MAHQSLIVSVHLLAALALLSGCNRESADEANLPRPVKSITVKAQQSIGPRFTGTVQAKVQTSLAFRLVGRVTFRPVQVSDLVKKGEIIAELDPVSLQLAVQKARASLRDAEARRTNAVTTEKRSRGLADRNLGSEADLELAEQGLKSAQASVVRARADFIKAREQLSYAEIRAEFDGVVTATDVEVGQTVTTGQPVVTLARLGRRDVAMDVSEAQLGSLRLGTRFDVALQLDNSIHTLGTLREIGPEADSNTRMHRLKIAVDEAPETFRLGSVVTATAIDTQPRPTMRLPISAIFRSGQSDCVWVVDPKTRTLSQRAVQLDSADDRFVQVVSGLHEGEAVAVAGIDELKAGQTVKLEEEPRS